ncbi:MAG: phage tail protein [Salinibacter sp.]
MPDRKRPYSQFNFRVKIGGNDGTSVAAGFQEVSGLGTEQTATEYRNGNEKENRPRKINTTYSVPDVTLSRGVIKASNLWDWMEKVRNGKQAESLEDVVIELRDESGENVAVSWTLTNARPLSYSGPTLSGTGTEVAVEELVLACEDIDMEFE